MKINGGLKLIIFLVALILIASCTLNAEQEASLSESTTRYLESRKNGAVLAYVSMHHPKVVRHYKDQGDSVFLQKFTVKPGAYYLDDPTIRKSKKEGETIHVLYKAKAIESEWNTNVNQIREFVAISENNGRSWFYVDKTDYVDKSIARDLDRLLELKN